MVANLDVQNNNQQPEFLIVKADRLTALLNFVAQAPLPMGRDQLVQDVIDSARPAQIEDDAPKGLQEVPSGSPEVPEASEAPS